MVHPIYTVAPLDGIKRHAGDAVTVTLNDGADVAAAAKAAKAADLAVVMVGNRDSEGKDRPSLSLDEGQDDLIVPPAQAHALAAQLTKQGIPHALLEFKEEAHGFRRTETIIAALEAELSLYAQTLNFPHPDTPQLRLHTAPPEVPIPQAEEAAPTPATSTPAPPATPPARPAPDLPPASRHPTGREQPSRA